MKEFKDDLRGTFLNLVSSTFHAEYSWEEELPEPEKKTVVGSSFRVTRIPFWKSITLQVEADIYDLEEKGKTKVFLDYIRRV